MRQRLVIVSVLGVVAAAVVAAQQGAPAAPQNPPGLTFRLGVDYVEVDANVTDARGQFVRGLAADDFEVLEDGQPQTVSVFSYVEVPRDPDDRPLYRTVPVRPDVYSNERPFTGRLYVLVLDDLHVHVTRTGQVRMAARRFVERYLGANDLAAIVHVGQPGANQEFTNDRFLLTRSIDRFSGQKLPSPTLNRLDDFMSKQDVPDLREKPPQDNDRPLRAEWARTTMGTLQTLSRYVSRLQGRRKAFLLFSEGIDYDLRNPLFESFSGLVIGSQASNIHLAMREVFMEATRANVSLYPIDPRGLITGTEPIVGLGGLPAVDPETQESPFPLSEVLEGLRLELDGSLDVLRMLAAETGGVAAVNTNDFEAPFNRVVSDSSSYYLIGYYPTNRSRNGAFRQVTVRVRGEGLQVRARRGYFAPRGDDAVRSAEDADPLRTVLAGPVPAGGLTMRAAAQAIRGAGPAAAATGRVHLVVEMARGSVPFELVDGLFRNQLKLSYEAVDAGGVRRITATQTATFALQPASRDQAERHGLAVTTEFALPPGRYQLRIGGFETLTGRAGSVYADLDVPAFATAPLAMSDLVLATPRHAFGFSLVKGTESVGRILPAPATTRRAFRAGEPLAVYTEVYSAERRPHVVDLAARLRTDDGREVFTSTDLRDGRDLAAGRAGSGYLVWIPLRDLNAGRYVLSVEARSRLGGTVVTKETELTVVK